MFKGPRFIIPDHSRVDDSSESLSMDAHFETFHSTPEDSKPLSTPLNYNSIFSSLGYSSFAIVSDLVPTLTSTDDITQGSNTSIVSAGSKDFIAKIFKSIHREKVEVLTSWKDRSEFHQVIIQLRSLNPLSLYEFTEHLNHKLGLQTQAGKPSGSHQSEISKASLYIGIDFKIENQITQAYVDGNFVCISTYGVQTIFEQPEKKAEFWNFLKLMKP